MKRTLWTLFTLLLIAGLSYVVFNLPGFSNNFNQPSYIRYKTNNSQVHYIDVPLGLDTLDYRASIKRDTNKKTHFIKFPNGGTATDVYLYGTDFLKTIQFHSLPKVQAITEGHFHGFEEAKLDISLVPSGTYYVHYLACGKGGTFPISIE